MAGVEVLGLVIGDIMARATGMMRTELGLEVL